MGLSPSSREVQAVLQVLAPRIATNLHEPGVSDIVIQAILRHSNVGPCEQDHFVRRSAQVELAAPKQCEQDWQSAALRRWVRWPRG